MDPNFQSRPDLRPLLSSLSCAQLLTTFRDQRTHDRKVTKARAKQALALAQRLANRRPNYTLDHLARSLLFSPLLSTCASIIASIIAGPTSPFSPSRRFYPPSP